VSPNASLTRDEPGTRKIYYMPDASYHQTGSVKALKGEAPTVRRRCHLIHQCGSFCKAGPITVKVATAFGWSVTAVH